MPDYQPLHLKQTEQAKSTANSPKSQRNPHHPATQFLAQQPKRNHRAQLTADAEAPIRTSVAVEEA